MARSVVAHYARIVHATYRDSLQEARALQRALQAFVAESSPESLEKAKAAWNAARVPYLQTEAFRFYAGPIDDAEGPEPEMNGWPIDESHIDAVEGAPQAGIINDPGQHPVISRELIEHMNEKAGETAITSGYHAIEFLLWGQDFDPEGPGTRAYTDYTTAPHAERRGTYLLACGDLLIGHLDYLVEAWAPDRPGNFRERFGNLPPREAVRDLIYGLHVMSGKELAGERLLVAWDTQDQEDEHSCFSDTTHHDMRLDALGIENVYLGRYRPLEGEPIVGPGARALLRLLLPGEVDAFDRKIRSARAALAEIPVPFDQAVIGEDEDPGRRAILRAVVELEDFAAMMARLQQAVISAP